MELGEEKMWDDPGVLANLGRDCYSARACENDELLASLMSTHPPDRARMPIQRPRYIPSPPLAVRTHPNVTCPDRCADADQILPHFVEKIVDSRTCRRQLETPMQSSLVPTPDAHPACWTMALRQPTLTAMPPVMTWYPPSHIAHWR